jgi:hypothetical protein
VPVKDIVWLTDNNEIGEGKAVYPLCCTPNCIKKSHLAQTTKDEHVSRQDCIGDIIFINKKHIVEKEVEDFLLIDFEQEKTTDGRLPCCCAIECKKCYFHEYSDQTINNVEHKDLPFNLEEPIAPKEDDTDKNSKIVAMRFSAKVAEELLKLCRWGAYQDSMEYIQDDDIRTKMQFWFRCNQPSGTYVHEQTTDGSVVYYLHLDKEHWAYDIAHKIKIRDLVWRANGHSIKEDQRVYSTCLNSKCARYDHLIAETYREHLKRISCGTVLCFKDGELNSVINCKHDKKCRILRHNLNE